MLSTPNLPMTEERIPYEGPDRRTNRISEGEMEAIAERAADRALAKVYESIGRSIVKKALWIIGAGVLALLAWLGGKGHLGG